MMIVIDVVAANDVGGARCRAGLPSEWAPIEETLSLLRSPRNAERLLEAVRGFEAGGKRI